MKYTRRVYFLVVAVAACRCGPVCLSSSRAARCLVASFPDSNDPGDSVLVIKKRVDEVNVLFIATDKHGKFVRNLNEDDFAILDDHKPPQAIVNFRRETDLPIELGLLIDTSGSVRTRFDFEQEAAGSFLQSLLRPSFDKAFVMGFNTHTQIAQDFTDDVKLLETGVSRLHNGGGTALYDAIYRACHDKLIKGRRPTIPCAAR